jgi:hypothetical protein
MSMSRKDYVAIADALGTQFARLSSVGDRVHHEQEILEALCFVFQQDNPSFNAITFKTAVYSRKGNEKWMLSLPKDAQTEERRKTPNSFATVTEGWVRPDGYRGPDKKASSRCESGGRDFCTCDVCF